MRIRPPELETSICDWAVKMKYRVSLSTRSVLGKWVYLVKLAMSLFDLQDVCIAIGSLATLDLPMFVDLIGIYGLKGLYSPKLAAPLLSQIRRRRRPPPSPPPPPLSDRTCSDQLFEEFPSVLISSGLLVQADEGTLLPVVDLIRRNLPPPTVKCRFPREIGRSQAPRRQQELIAFLTKGSDDKKGEDSSSRRPQPPPDDQNRPGGGSGSRPNDLSRFGGVSVSRYVGTRGSGSESRRRGDKSGSIEKKIQWCCFSSHIDPITYANRLLKGDVFANLSKLDASFQKHYQTKRLSKRSPTLPLLLQSELPTTGNRRK
ncbi:hypothetical protein F511_09138 [Dorcoceras hygrometricum]|uniref:Uncharacterized protein n=1 Tax=Dorcoceras hygrometricum TaxID=472368 RepID=A0A2Z7AQN3_9LAMI|nr:hypothetical protein F511_09138 [Dorcoceras hygrometricum]